MVWYMDQHGRRFVVLLPYPVVDLGEGPTEGRKVGRASTTKPPPLPLPLARGLDPPLVPSCENTQLNPSISYFVTDHVKFAIWYNSIVAAKPTKPANAKVALEGLKQQHLGVDSHIKILGK